MDIKSLFDSTLKYINYNNFFENFKDKYLGNNEFIFYTLISIVAIYIILYIILFLFRLPIIIIMSIFVAMALQKYYPKR